MSTAKTKAAAAAELEAAIDAAMAPGKTAEEQLMGLQAIAKDAKKAEAEARAKAEAEAQQREEAAKAAMAALTKRQGVGNVYYLVNPKGAIHGVDRAHAATRLKVAGWRLATEEEITVYLGQAVQRHDHPICQPWTPDPDKQLAALE